MDDWENLHETSMLEKEDFDCHLNMEDVTDANYTHAKIFRKNFEIKNLGEYHNLYVQNGILLLTDIFNNFMCLEIYGLDPAHFLPAPGLVAFRKAKVMLDLLTHIGMLPMVEKVLEMKYAMLVIYMRKLIANT